MDQGRCLFCQISQGKLSSKKIYEDDDFVCFHDIKPKAPVHLLLITRKHIVSLQEVSHRDIDLLGRMIVLVPFLAIKGGCLNGYEGGFQLMNNSGIQGGQEIPHLHFHILGGLNYN
ncbi:MAG: HIT domain-containing protein [Bordetella sp.]|nr:MAG: HIT domain-containing protein [Bordetella sp.]